MDENTSLERTAQALGIGAVVPMAYNDLLAPAARELGEGLVVIAKTVNLSLAPLRGLLWGHDRAMEWLHVRVTALLAERKATKIQGPSPIVAGPLMLNAMFSQEEHDLREMYAKLLATAMDSATASKAHPSFSTIIQQMSSAEAKLLLHIASREDKWPCWSGDQESDELERELRKLCDSAGISDTVLADLAVDNLIRLRILRSFSGSDAVNTQGFSRDPEHFEDEIKVRTSEYVELSSFGKAFIVACVLDRPSTEL